MKHPNLQLLLLAVLASVLAWNSPSWSASEAVELTATEFISAGSIWRFDATGTDLGTSWRDPGFDDTAWDSGPGILGYGETYVVTPVPFGPNASDKYRTTYFRISFDVGFDPTITTQLQLLANHDDGAVVYLNGTEVARPSMPAGTITYSTFASSHESGSYELLDLTDSVGLLLSGSNVLAVEVHQTSASSSDLIWDAILVADTSQIQFMWSGGVTESSVRVKARLLSEGSVARLAVDADSLFPAPIMSAPDTALLGDNNRVVDLTLTGLSPSTQYYYALELGGNLKTERIGRFRTFPPSSGESFTIALGSCSQTGSAHAVFETIRTHDPLMLLHMGDLHYLNIGVNDPDVFRAAYETVLASAPQSELYQSVPIAYVWDDHDYGPNNSDSTAPGRVASRLTYQEYVPHYPLVAGTGDVPIYQTFDIGRVHFIVADSRSARSSASSTDNSAKTMLGTTQKAWLKQELLHADTTYPLIVWVNSLPWIGVTGDDGWHLYTNERREMADFIAANGIDGLCMVSGDAHMLAIDNGTNSDYATSGAAPFPVMHAAALDRSGSVKGGPYSEGTYPGPGQFGLMTVIDTGGSFVDVEWSGRNWLDEEIVALRFRVPVVDGSICECACHADAACDQFTDILDVTSAIDVAFGGLPQGSHPLCPVYEMDANCDGLTNVLDVTILIDVAFRAVSRDVLCDPCGN